jgi:hypothetical protein
MRAAAAPQSVSRKCKKPADIGVTRQRSVQLRVLTRDRIAREARAGKREREKERERDRGAQPRNGRDYWSHTRGTYHIQREDTLSTPCRKGDILRIRDIREMKHASAAFAASRFVPLETPRAERSARQVSGEITGRERDVKRINLAGGCGLALLVSGTACFRFARRTRGGTKRENRRLHNAWLISIAVGR